MPPLSLLCVGIIVFRAKALAKFQNTTFTHYSTKLCVTPFGFQDQVQQTILTKISKKLYGSHVDKYDLLNILGTPTSPVGVREQMLGEIYGCRVSR